MNAKAFGDAFGHGGFPRTIKVLRNKGASPDEAEEIAAKVWCRAWERLAQLRDDTRLVPWVISSGIRELRDFQRRRGFTAIDDGPEPASEPDVSVAKIDLYRTLRMLSTPQAAILQSVYLQGDSPADMAAALKISNQAVLARLSRARRALRRAMTTA